MQAIRDEMMEECSLYFTFATDAQLVKDFPDLIAVFTAVSLYSLESVKFR